MCKRTKNILISIVTVALLVGTILLSTGIFTQAQSRDFSTTDTYESTGGVFSYEYIFEHYNAFTFEDILLDMAHINGGIIAGGRASGMDAQNDFILYDIETNSYKVNYKVTDTWFGVMDHESYFLTKAKPVYVGGRAYIYNIHKNIIVDAYFGPDNVLDFYSEHDRRYRLNHNVGAGPGGAIISNPDSKAFVLSDKDYFIDWHKAIELISKESEALYNKGKESIDKTDRYIDIHDLEYIETDGYSTGVGFVKVYEGETVTISEEVLKDNRLNYVLFVTDKSDDNKSTGPFDSDKTVISYEVTGDFHHVETRWADKDTNIDDISNHISLSDLERWFPNHEPGWANNFDKYAETLNLVHNYPFATKVLTMRSTAQRVGHLLLLTQVYMMQLGTLRVQ